jgi:ATP synthase protein I
LSKKILSSIRSQAFSFVLAQAIVVFCAACFLYFFAKKITALSFLWGGMICVLPNAYFAHKLFTQTGAQASRQIVTSFYVGEVVKFILTFILFAAVFKYVETNKLLVIIGYIFAQLVFWLAALIRNLNG